MNTIIQLSLLFVSLFSVHSLQAQTFESILESYWDGASRSRAVETESGYFYCTQYLSNVTYDISDDTFTGDLETVFKLEGYTYSSKWKVNGYVDSDNFNVTLVPYYEIHSDPLPGDLYWIDEKIYLTLYKDNEHSGYFLMKGESESMNYSDEVFELGNYPY